MRQDWLPVEPEDAELRGERHSAFRVSADNFQRNELAKHEPLVEVVSLQLEKPANNTLNVSGRRRPGLIYGAKTAQFCGKSVSTRSAGVESRRVRMSVKYASGSTSFATQVATTV